MKQILMILGIFLLWTSCSGEKEFTIEGTIAGVKDGEMLYLQREGVEGTSVLDSVKIQPSGEFKMKSPQPDFPDFYSLRMGKELIHFCVDSTEVQRITGSRNGLSGNYEISGNINSEKMKEIVSKQRQLQESFLALTEAVNKKEILPESARDSLDQMLGRYKEDMRLNYIFAEPDKMYAYYALFQQIGGMLIFDVNSKQDITLFQAVGTCMNTFWPEALRTVNLYNMVMKGLKNIRVNESRSLQQIPQEKIKETGLLEIALQDRKGTTRTLTSLKGKVVLLDFILQSDPGSVQHNLFLRELYTKYQGQGLEIYQVAEDPDHHYWRTVSDALPWICVVEDPEFPGAVAARYNVTSVPTMFLISRENNLLTRHLTTKGLEAALKKELGV